MVDDDELARWVLEAFLLTRCRCEVITAPNGLDGLGLIQRESPDVVFLDVGMPVMDGLELLEAVRADPAHARVPVIVMTGTTDRALVGRMIGLGVTDYLLKPFRPEATGPRVARALARLQSRSPRSPAGPPVPAARRPPVLVADPDAGFRARAVAALSARFEVCEAANGLAALRVWLERTPEIVCLGERLGLLNEDLLARKIRRVAGERPVAIYLCAEQPGRAAADPTLYTGVLARRHEPEALRDEFLRQVSGQVTGPDVVAELIRSDLKPEILTAVGQAIGVATGQDVEVTAEAPGGSARGELWVAVELSAREPQGVVVTAGLGGPETEAMGLAELLLNEPPGSPERITTAFGEVLTTIAGRVRALLDGRGISVEVGAPRRLLDDAGTPPLDWLLRLGVQVQGGGLFAVGVASSIPR